MISDILSDALHDIADYRRDIPNAYKNVRPELDALVAHMTEVRIMLDSPVLQPRARRWQAAKATE